MPLIEGFGDEVTLVFFGLLAIILVILAWMSTQVESSFLVPIIILDRDRFSALMQRWRRIAEQRFAAVGQLNNDSQSVGESSEQSPIPETISSVSTNSLHPVPSQQETELSDGSSLSDQTSMLASKVRSGCVVDNESSHITPTNSNILSSENQVAESERSQDCETSMHDVTSTRDVPSVAISPELATAQDNSAASLTDENLGSSQVTAVDNRESSSIPEGHVQIRLQYVDGRQRMVSANPDETIGDFKRNHFSTELANQSVVRFVMSGQELRNDELTLRSYRVSDGSVIHCLITQARVDPAVTSVDSHHFDIGVLMLPLFGFLLTLLWYARFVYRNYFSGASTCSLVAISFLYVIALIGSYRSNRLNHPHQE